MQTPDERFWAECPGYYVTKTAVKSWLKSKTYPILVCITRGHWHTTLFINDTSKQNPHFNRVDLGLSGDLQTKTMQSFPRSPLSALFRNYVSTYRTFEYNWYSFHVKSTATTSIAVIFYSGPAYCLASKTALWVISERHLTTNGSGSKVEYSTSELGKNSRSRRTPPP